MSNLTPIPNTPNEIVTQSLPTPRSYLSRPNDSYQLAIVNTLIAIRHSPPKHSHQGVYRPSAFS